MEINIQTNNISRTTINEKFVKKIAGIVIANETRNSFDDQEIEVSIAFVSPEKIKELNKRYRGVGRATDVLSFAGDNIAEEKSGYPLILGEIIICPREVRKNAKEFKTSFRKELAWAIIHGIMHLFGHNHKTRRDAAKMRQREVLYLSKLKIENEKVKTKVKN